MENYLEEIEHGESKEVLKDPTSIVVVTGTFYPGWYPGEPKEHSPYDKVRGDLALQALLVAKNQEFQIALVDGGSSPEFLKKLKENEIPFEVQREKGAGAARRLGVKIAQNLEGVKVICETEPEKVSVIADCLALASTPILNDEADIVIPKRSEESFSTYPHYQQKAEKRANKLYNQILRKHSLLRENEPDLDFWFGVRIFANRPEVVEFFRKHYQFKPSEAALHKIIKPDAYSNPIFFPVVAALKDGLRVKSVEVPYRHPKEQTQFEEGNPELDRRRDIQRRTIVTELVHFIRYLEDSEKSRIEEVR